MEDRWHGPEDPTNQDSETTRKKRRGTDFLSQYLLRRKESQGERAEEDDDEETEEKPKKFRRFFKGLFKNVVEPPEGAGERPSKRFSFESLFMGNQNESEPEEASKAERTQSQEVGQPDQDIVALSSEVTEEHQRQPAEHQAENSLVSSSETTPDDTQPSTSLESQSNEPIVPERFTSDNRAIFERSQAQPVEKEIIIERGTGTALPVVLVGAEYLARKKADKKLDAKYDEKVTKLETENKQRDFATEQLDTLVKQNKEQLEALKRDRGIEFTPDKPRTAERATPRVEQQRPEQNTPRLTPEKAPELATEKPETYRLMEQVAEAAEHDVPVERAFERSHEVKDDQSTHIGAASIGSIMAEQVAKQRVNGPVATQLSQDASGLPVVSGRAQATAYKQAMRNGFWAAIIIIILGTIAYLLK